MKEIALPNREKSGQEPSSRNSGLWPILVVPVVSLWALLILILALCGAYSGSPEDPPLAILVSVTTPVAVFLAAYRAWRPFRLWIGSLDERPLVLLHTWRMLGMGFVFLYFHGKLPALFALPSGLGDAVAAAGALFLGMALYSGKPVAVWKKHVWNTFGLLDFIVAIGAGVVTRTMWNGGIPSTAMGEFPLALIPGFIVPFYIIIHFMLFLKWRRAVR